MCYSLQASKDHYLCAKLTISTKLPSTTESKATSDRAESTRIDQKRSEKGVDSGVVKNANDESLNEKTQVNPGNSLVVRAGIEPATHGFSVRERPNEFIDEIEHEAKRAQKRAHFDQDQRLFDIIELWPNLTEAERNSIHKIVSDAPSKRRT